MHACLTDFLKINGKEKSYTGIETGFSRNCLFNVQGFIILGMSYDMSLYIIVDIKVMAIEVLKTKLLSIAFYVLKLQKHENYQNHIWP